MEYIVSLQGGMACGKTTLARKINEQNNDIVVSYEDVSSLIKIIKSENLDKRKLEEYIKIQKLFINYELERYKKLKIHNKVIIDLGLEEIEFYTLNYPKSIGMDWNIEKMMKNELNELRKHQNTLNIFLDCDEDVLKKRKDNDLFRTRNFFDFYISSMHSLKRKWFKNRENTIFIDTTKLSSDDVYYKVMEVLYKL